MKRFIQSGLLALAGIILLPGVSCVMPEPITTPAAESTVAPALDSVTATPAAEHTATTTVPPTVQQFPVFNPVTATPEPLAPLPVDWGNLSPDEPVVVVSCSNQRGRPHFSLLGGDWVGKVYVTLTQERLEIRKSRERRPLTEDEVARLSNTGTPFALINQGFRARTPPFGIGGNIYGGCWGALTRYYGIVKTPRGEMPGLILDSFMPWPQ